MINMAAGIQIGSAIIPIIKTIELTGNPDSNNTGPANIQNNFIPQADFGSGVTIGTGSAPKSGTPTMNTSWSGAQTALRSHTEGTVGWVTATGPITAGAEMYGTVHVAINGTAITTNAILRCCHTLGGSSSSYSWESQVQWVALRYSYPEALDPYWQVSGYCVAALERTKQSNIEEPSYGLVNYFVLAIPNINRNNGTTFTYTEEWVPDPEPEFDPSQPDPYDPSHDDTSDEVPIPSDPPIGVTGAGFINVYKPGLGSLQGLGEILFPNPASATDIVDAVLKLCETLANQNLINYVIDCHVIPCAPVTGANAAIKVGYRNTGISVPTVTSDYVNVTCGALNIQEYFGGFADYTGTVSKIYLPFIGFVDTKPEFWQAGIIAVDYKFNVIDGSFMCFIRSSSSKSQLSNTVIAQYAGNACMHFPLTGVNYSQMVSGVVGSVVAMASKGKVINQDALSAANTIAQGGDVQQSNGYNSTAAILGVRTPFLMIERVKTSYPSGYGHSKGFPSNITTLLSNVHGFTIISDIDLSGIPFTIEELSELRSLLNEGVYF